MENQTNCQNNPQRWDPLMLKLRTLLPIGPLNSLCSHIGKTIGQTSNWKIVLAKVIGISPISFSGPSPWLVSVIPWLNHYLSHVSFSDVKLQHQHPELSFFFPFPLISHKMESTLPFISPSLPKTGTTFMWLEPSLQRDRDNT
jgi:hypothetical protein